jgi:CP family cyanate transporter-like MFS transporter
VRRPNANFYVAVLLVALNLRTVFASLPPLLDRIRDDLGLSATVGGLLTTGPVLCFGLLAPVVPRLVRRVPIERVIAICAALTAVGAAARGLGVAGLFAGTVLAGAAVAVAQTAIPILLRTRFGGHTGSLTGAFSMALTLGAAVAAATAVPLERAFGSWRGALAVFAVPAAAAAVVWITPRRTLVPRERSLGLRGNRRAWSLAVYFGLQSTAFYAGLTWLPSVLKDAGYSEAAAGGLQALANLLQFAPAFLVPVLAVRRATQTWLLVLLALVAAGGLAGILVEPGAAPLWMCVIGLAQGGGLGLALILPVLRGGSAHAVASLTAMSLSVGYLIAATGPSLAGLAHDLSGGWDATLALLIAVTLAEIAVGVPATRAWTVAHD